MLGIANRINGIGGVEKVEIYGVRDGKIEVVTIDEQTQTYIRGLKSTYVRGEERELEGKVKELNTNHFIVTLTDDARSVDVSLTPVEFEKCVMRGSHFRGLKYVDSLYTDWE
ncbi:MAG: hypothetical protein IPP19_09980 [Verrucomicrobia bacterium]|nr:hypothetical protein [Verrucomicrobiota bacterium]